MKLKGSQVFYLFVIILVAGVYFFDYRSGEEKIKRNEESSVLVSILKDDISRIEVKNRSGEIEIQKTEAGWDLKKPIVDLAAVDDVSAWIQAFTTEKSIEKIGEGETFDWSTYGLDKPMGTLIVYPKTGDPIRLQISEKKSFEGNPFVRKNEEIVVYVGNPVWSSLVEKTANDLRDKKILRLALHDLVSFNISLGSTTLPLKLEEGRWIAPSQNHWHLDQNKVRELVSIVQEMKVVQFVSETKPNKDQMATYGMTKPALKVEYHLQGDKVWSAEFSQDKEKTWFVWVPDLQKVGKVDAATVDKLTKFNLSDYRDREEPFIFNKQDVRKLSLVVGKTIELNRDGESWKASEPGLVDDQEVSQLMDRIRELRVAEFLDGKTTAPGIEKSQKHFTLAEASGKPLFDIRIGDTFKRGSGKAEKALVYAKSSVYPEVFALSQEDIKTLNTDKLLKNETQALEAKTSSDESLDGATTPETKKQ